MLRGRFWSRAAGRRWSPLLLILGSVLFAPVSVLAVDAASVDWSCTGGIPPMRAEVMSAKVVNCAKDVPGRGRLQKRVLWLYGSVDERAAQRVIRNIRNSAYQEVWLNSPGGYVDQGLAIGKALRARKVVLRVIRHPAVSCVSACTIITMGGYNRIIERNADFIVHAASLFLHELKDSMAAQFDCADSHSAACNEKRAELLQAFAAEVQAETHKGIVRMFTYYQQMLDGQPRKNVMQTISLANSAIYAPGAEQGRSLKDDLALVANGGSVALQEIFTQFERRTARLLIARARAKVQSDPAPYGLGALESVRLHEAMFMCRIQDYCSLQREQLLNVGYHNFEMANE